MLWGVPLWVYLGLIGLVVVYFLLDRRYPGGIARFEEGTIALLLAVMTLVQFTQVIARYGFNTGWTGALEFTRILFAWLILFGMSYGVRVSAHLGVDALVRLFPRPVYRIFAMFAAVCGVMYAVILLSGDWLAELGVDTKGGAIFYWARFFRAGIGLDDLLYPMWMQEAFGMQERVHRWVAYLILPIGLGLFAFRCIQALIAIASGRRHSMIAAHEAEELVAE
ncbi:MAG: TRAP transporter small permease, partial [Burkholderiales bacterium]